MIHRTFEFIRKKLRDAQLYFFRKAFKDGDVSSILDSFKSLNNEISAYLPEIGPLPKSLYTHQYEELTRKLMIIDSFELTTVDGQQWITFIDNETFNLTEILAFTNFEHLIFNEIDTFKYEQYIKNHSTMVPQVSVSQTKAPILEQFGVDKEKMHFFPTKEYFSAVDHEGLFNNLSYGEKLSINLYTGILYEPMNALLRGYYDYKQHSLAEIRDVIVHASMCAFALSKQDASPIKGAFRGEKVYGDVIEKRIKIIESGGALIEKGFISSSTSPYGVVSSNISILYTNLKGKYIAPLSGAPLESEYLIPPTQMTYKGHVLYENVHYFHAEPVVNLELVNEKAKEMPSIIENIQFKIKELLVNLSMVRPYILENCNENEYNVLDSDLSDIESWAKQQLDTLNLNEASPEQAQCQRVDMWEKLSKLTMKSYIYQQRILHDLHQQDESSIAKPNLKLM